MSFAVKHGERIGVVGRTGSGKSSLAEAVFNLTPVSDGVIYVNGICQKDYINLRCLRSKIAFIPQEPALFSGTVRDNLKIQEGINDTELVEALELVQLFNLELDGEVESNGGNLSVGERQLQEVSEKW